MKPNTTAAGNENFKQVLLRNSFYQDRAHTVLGALVLSGVANLIMALAVLVFIFNPPPAEFIVANPDGSLIKTVPLSQPQKSDVMMRNFAANAASQINSLDWSNFATQLSAIRNLFTPEGWNEYKKGLDKTNIVKYITDNNLVMSAAITSVPQIAAQAVLNGKYTWKIEVPLILTFSGGTINQSESKKVTLVIQQVDFLESPNGVAIVQYLMQ